MPSEFDSLSTLADWSAKLSELLVAARAASESNNDDSRLSIAARLTEFMSRSSPASSEIHRLDELASAAARALVEQVSGDALERIASRTAVFETLAGELDTIRAGAGSAHVPSASSIAGLASGLTAVAQDAKELARFRAQNAENSGEFRLRFTRIADTLADLHSSFRAFLSTSPEPRPKASGTVIAEAPRGNP